MSVTPLWKIRSGQFAGWHTNNALYNDAGDHVGYLAGHIVYGLDGRPLGELHQAEWIGRKCGVHYPAGETHPVCGSVAHARLPDRAGLSVPDWTDPAP